MVRDTLGFGFLLFSISPRTRLRRGIICAVLAALLAGALTLAASAPAQARQAYIVLDAETGEVLSAANANAYHPPASLTKMMVLYMAFEAIEAGKLSLDKRLLVSRRAARQRPSRLGLGAKTRITVRDAIMAMITKSANDAAVVMAEALGRSERKFARMMTTRAREMGMKHTTFRNATGLYSRGQISSARDMAVLARALITDFPQYYGRFAIRKFSFKGRTYKNHNRLLGRYPGLDGIKTGYIRASGYNVAVSAARDGRRVVAVYLGGRTARKRDRRMVALLNKAFASFAAARPDDGPLDRKNGSNAKIADINPAAGTAKTRGAANFGLGGWAIQVGAYYRRASAKRAIARANRKLPGWFGEEQVAILPVAVKRGTVYRARFYGLTEARAADACRRLRKKRQRCITVSPAGFNLALAR